MNKYFWVYPSQNICIQHASKSPFLDQQSNVSFHDTQCIHSLYCINPNQCILLFHHSLQLSAKALLKPFYSARLLDTNDDIDSDNGIVLQVVDDEEEEEEDEDYDEMDDDKDKEEEEDPLSILDDDKREGLIQNTEAVCTMLMKVCTSLLSVLFCPHLCCHSRFAKSPLPLSIPPPLPFLHGMKPVLLTPFLYSLSLMMSKLNGILHMICGT